MNMIEDMKLRIILLEQEVEALRSVLAEGSNDNLEFNQMNKANAIEEVLLHFKRPEL